MAIMAQRCRACLRNLSAPTDAPPVSIVRPLRGSESFSEETLRATFAADYPNYEFLLCVQSAKDPIIPPAKHVMSELPDRSARLLSRDDKIGDNPKLTNCFN